MSSTDVNPKTRVEDVKADLIDLCERSDTSSEAKFNIAKLVRKLEDLGEDVGIGQGSAISGLLSGKWNLIYATEDTTRSSPFFWAFRKAFPDKSDDIFAITDAIPEPLKEVGPASQEIDYNESKGTGSLVSRVKVTALGGMSSSMMTTRCTILSSEGIDTIRVRVDTTKPEDSTLLDKLGPLGQKLKETAPPFPSGEALEKVKKGSSEVLIHNTYCDETLRIARNMDGVDDFYIWLREGFLGDFEV